MSGKDSNYWEGRKKIGRPKDLKSPEQLWELACEYFQRCDNTPWLRTDFKGKDAIEVHIPTSRPYTWSGFDDFLFEKIGLSRLQDYKDNKDGRYSEFAYIITRIGQIMRTQKFEGAAVGAFNPNIIAREIGLSEKTELELSSKKDFTIKIVKKDE